LLVNGVRLNQKLTDMNHIDSKLFSLIVQH